MDKLKRSLSFRKKHESSTTESSKPHQWQEDEKKVREGTCSFQVRYLGCIEVFESRGIQVCEEAIKGLKSSKGKSQRAILYVSGDALRVVDEISKGLIVDQTIEKVSFCAPDRNNEKGFAYICRDGTTRRWMCHGFLALKESGERLSHAVGCAFTVCLEKKQSREKEKVTVTFNENGTSFTRTGSFRQTTLTERLADPQSAIIAEPVPVKMTENLYEVQRPRAPVDMLQRQNSFRGFSKLAETSPFKRQMSLRLDELSATIDRQKRFTDGSSSSSSNGGGGGGGLENMSCPMSAHVAISPIIEASPSNDEHSDMLSQLCRQVSHGLSAMTTDDPFLAASPGAGFVSAARSQSHTSRIASAPAGGAARHSTSFHPGTVAHAAVDPSEPIRQNNPWSSTQFHNKTGSKVSEADFWLHTTSNIVGGTTGTQSNVVRGTTGNQSNVIRGTMGNRSGAGHIQSCTTNGLPPQSNAYLESAVHLSQHAPSRAQQPSVIQNAPPVRQQLRTQSVDSAYSSQYKAPFYNGGRSPSLSLNHQMRQPGTFRGSKPSGSRGVLSFIDPFDAAWAAKVAGKSTNPFHSSVDSSTTKSFELRL